MRIPVWIVLAAGMCAQGQWLNYPNPGTPRTRDGKPNLSAQAPRASNGKPDLSGVWQVEAPPPGEIERLFPNIGDFNVPGDDPTTFSKYFINILADFRPEEAPMRRETAELFGKHAAGLSKDSPTARCLPMGLPGPHLIAFPYKIVQTPGVILLLAEADGTHRQVYTDGRKHTADPQPSWLGYSTGMWEGDTLVIETVGFNDKSWLDAAGHPHSESLHLTERLRRRDFGHMEVQMTIDDPKAYTMPFTIKVNQLLIPDSDIIESVCNENEKDRRHF